MAKTLTAANAVLVITIPGVFSSGVQLQGFGADDVTDWEALERVETVPGVDGKLSGGYVYKQVMQGITLQADSDSNDVFDAWAAAEDAARETINATMTIVMPGLGRVSQCTKGFLKKRSPNPDAKKLMKERKWGIEWENVASAFI